MKIDDFINMIKYKRCLTVIASVDKGSFVILGFGLDIPDDIYLEYNTLSENEKICLSELKLMIYCAWRLMKDNKIICGWRDDEAVDNGVLEQIKFLRNKKIIGIDIKTAYDLDIHFEGDFCLQLFCDQTNNEFSNGNYILYTDNAVCTVGLKSCIKFEYY